MPDTTNQEQDLPADVRTGGLSPDDEPDGEDAADEAHEAVVEDQ